jgi:hypothetical protein
MSKNTNLSFLTDYITADITNGRIGINNASPTVAFDVVGVAKFSSSVSASDLIISDTYANDPLIKLATTTSGSVEVQMRTATTTYNAGIGVVTSGYDFNFFTANSTRMTINSAGNVGIGVTPNASWNSTWKVLQIGNTGSVHYTGVDYNATRLANGAYYSTSDAWTYLATSVNPSMINLQADGNLIFYNASSGTAGGTFSWNERMRITSGGSLLMAKNSVIGINTTDGSDDGYLGLCGAGDGGENRGGHIYLSGNERSADPGSVVISAGNVIGTGSFIFFRTAGTEKVRIVGSGNVIIGSTSDNGYKLQVTGSIYATGSIVANSDLTLKKNIAIINNPIDKLMELNGYSYQWKSNDEHQYGVIAQEVEKILPYAVSTGDDGIKGVSYNQIIPVLIEAIKELSAEITILKNK